MKQTKTFHRPHIKVRETQLQGVHRVIVLLLLNPDKNYSLQALVRTALINEFDLKRMFRQVTGKNIHAFVVDHRISLAKQLLAGTCKTIRQVSEACGYSPEYFTILFRQKTGFSPAAYRKSLD